MAEPRLIHEIDVEEEDLGIKEWSAVDRPATGIDFRMFKGDGDDKAQRRREGGGMPKQDEMPPEAVEQPAAGGAEVVPEMEVEGVVEIPTSPTRFPISQCIETAMEQGFGQDESIGLCQLVARQYGDPDDVDTIMLPEGSTPEGLLNQMAVDHGVAKPQGTAPEMTASFDDGKRGGYWWKLLKRMAGMKDPTPEQRLLIKTAKEVSIVRDNLVDQEKRSQELMEVLRATLGIIARDRGIDPATLPQITAAVETEEDPSVAAEGAAAAAPEGKAETPEEELIRLRARNAELQSTNVELQGLVGGRPAEAVAALVPAGGGTQIVAMPAAAAYLGPPGDEPAVDAIMQPAVVMAPAEEPQKRGVPVSVAPAQIKSRSGEELVPLTLLGGALVPKSDLVEQGYRF